MPQLMTLYRDIHANPELSMQEVRTPAMLAPEMRQLGFTVTEHVGRTGVVAVMKNGPGPVLLIRADMDALPVKEQTGLPFACQVRGTPPDGRRDRRHARLRPRHPYDDLARHRPAPGGDEDQWSGTLVMIPQPGEEIGDRRQGDARRRAVHPLPQARPALAFHDSASLPAGVIGVARGYALANVDSVDIDVNGVGGHGAYPHTTKDPIVLASRIVTALQTLVSRENNPLDPAVVTVGSFHSGTKHNIISDDARLQLTVRSYTPEVRKQLLDGIAPDRARRGDRRRHARGPDAGGHRPRAATRPRPSTRPSCPAA